MAGELGEYSSALVTESSVVITDTTGTATTYTRSGTTSSYTAPPGEYGVVTVDTSAGQPTSGQVTLTEEDGTVHVFTAAGRLASSTGPADVTKPAAPKIDYRLGTGQLATITDRLSGRQPRFGYAGETVESLGLSAADAGTGPACPVLPGYAAPPAGMVCRIFYPRVRADGPLDTTELVYDASGRLVRIIDPGAEVTDFGYDANGRLTAVRDSLANDWLTADATRSAAAVATVIGYDTQGRATSVTLPAPDGTTTTPRPARTYTYATPSNPNDPASTGTTHVDVAGLKAASTPAPASDRARTVTFDNAWRQLSDTSALGLTGRQVWNAKDMVLSSTDPSGRMSTTVYDGTDRATDTYGPAPAACFGPDRRPVTPAPAGCTVTPAHTSTRYDENLRGLAATYYNNMHLSGQPVAYGTGLAAYPGGELVGAWAGSPAAGVNADAFSARFTGTITFPAAGTYQLVTYGDDGIRVWVDDILRIDMWADGGRRRSPDAPITVTAGQKARIRVDYYDLTGPGAAELHWIRPDGGSGLVPGSQLSPDYGLVTSTTTDDSAPATAVGGAAAASTRVPSQTTASVYANPWLGTLASSIVDPGGLNLQTDTAQEALGSGYLRPVAKRLPGAVAAGQPSTTHGITYAYYGEKETLAAAYPTGVPCGLPGDTIQAGMVRRTSSAVPSTGSRQEIEVVYDGFGRMVGSRKVADAAEPGGGWSCTTFDARGRTVTISHPAYAGIPARTATTRYTGDGTATGDPLTTSVRDVSSTGASVPGSPNSGTITTVTDLLGRVTSTTDVWGTVSTVVYDRVGRATSVSTTPLGASSSVMTSTYDADGRQRSVVKDGLVLATLTYGGAELTGVSYPGGTGSAGNGSGLAIGRDGAGALASLGWTLPASSAGRPGRCRSGERGERSGGAVAVGAGGGRGDERRHRDDREDVHGFLHL